MIAAETSCNLFVLAAGIAASRCVPLFNPINNRPLSQPRTFPPLNTNTDAAGEILRAASHSATGLPRWESPRGDPKESFLSFIIYIVFAIRSIERGLKLLV